MDALSNHEINKFNNQSNWGDLATCNIPVGFAWLKAAMESLQIMGKDNSGVWKWYPGAGKLLLKYIELFGWRQVKCTQMQ